MRVDEFEEDDGDEEKEGWLGGEIKREFLKTEKTFAFFAKSVILFSVVIYSVFFLLSFYTSY